MTNLETATTRLLNAVNAVAANWQKVPDVTPALEAINQATEHLEALVRPMPETDGPVRARLARQRALDAGILPTVETPAVVIPVVPEVPVIETGDVPS